MTQKGDGIARLRVIGVNHGLFIRIPVKEVELWEMKLPSLVGHRATLFIRPAPVEPKHGFLPSFAIDSVYCVEAVRMVAAKMAEHGEENGEVLVTSYIPSVYSSVVHDGVIAVGPGHDGATAGKGSIIFPVPLNTVGHALEIVHPRIGMSCWVQDRKAPSVDYRGGNIVGNGRTIVENAAILSANGITDLEFPKWLEELRELHGESLVVFDEGGNPASHKAMWCAIHGVPYSWKEPPGECGSTIKIEGQEPVRDPFDHPDIEPGVHAGLFLDSGVLCDLWAVKSPDSRVARYQMRSILTAAAVGATQAGRQFWIDHPMLFGFSVGWLIHACYIACMGELRHHYRGLPRYRRADRSVVYDVFEVPRTFGIRRMSAFRMRGWRDCYGGVRWAAIADSVVAAIRAVIDKDWQLACDIAGRLVVMSHNTDRALTKFIGRDTLRQITEGKLWVYGDMIPTWAFLVESRSVLRQLVQGKEKSLLSQLRRGTANTAETPSFKQTA